MREMLRLQGIDPSQFVQVVSDTVVGEMVGNAMSGDLFGVQKSSPGNPWDP